MLVEVILLPFARRVLEPFVVHGEALHQILIQAPDRPLPELRAPVAADAETDRENGVQVIVLDLSRDFPFTLDSNYSEFPNSCLSRQFFNGVNALQMFVHRGHGDLEQLGNLCLRQPQGFILKTTLDARAAILGLVKDDFRLGQMFVTHGSSSKMNR